MDCKKYRSATSNIRDFPQRTPKLLSRLEQSISGNYEQTFSARAQLDRLSLDCSICAQQLPKLLYFWPCCFSYSPQNFLLQYSTACENSFSLQWQFPIWKMRSWQSLSDSHSFPNPQRNSFSSCLKAQRASSNSPCWYSARPWLRPVSGQSVSSLFLCPYLQLISVRQRVFPKAEYLVSARFLDSRVRTVFSGLFSFRWRTRVKRSKSDQFMSFSMDQRMAMPLRPLRSIISLVSFIRRNRLYAEEQAHLKKAKHFQRGRAQGEQMCGGNEVERYLVLKKGGWIGQKEEHLEINKRLEVKGEQWRIACGQTDDEDGVKYKDCIKL